MKNRLDRRQFGKGLIGGAALALTGREASATQKSEVNHPQNTRWQPVVQGVWCATAGEPEAITPVRSRLVSPCTDALRRLPHISIPAIDPPVFRLGPRGTQLSLPLDSHEEIYGFGLQFFSMNHRGKKRAIRVNADPRSDTGDSHAPVPFYVSSRGYGLLVDTARYATFYCGEALPRPSVSSEEETGDVPLYTKTLQDGEASRIVVEIPAARGADVYLFAGPSMLDAVRRYNLFSGGGVMPPEWGLGCWYRAVSNATDHDIIRLAT